jgi:excisionase family DNA binding protein
MKRKRMASTSTKLEPITVAPDGLRQLLGISRGKSYELIRTGQIPHVRLGKSIRIPVALLTEWLNERAAASGKGNGSTEERNAVRLQRRKA